MRAFVSRSLAAARSFTTRSALPRLDTITPLSTASPLRVAAVAAGTAAVAASSVAAACAAANPLTGNPLSCNVLRTEMKMNVMMDKDSDGRLTKEEIDSVFDALDKNKDGVVTFQEFHDYLVASGMSKQKCAALEALFKTLDKDGSGTLSREELHEHFHPDYLARYARGVVVAFLTKGRFIAYTSDIGESARPVMPRWFVNGCYGLTFLYVIVAVAHHTYEASITDGVSQMMVYRTLAHSATFELIASVAMPSLIIHQAVHFAQHHAHRLPAGPVARWAPTMVGLCCIPFLPYLDPPAERVIDATFEYAWPDDGTLPAKTHH